MTLTQLSNGLVCVLRHKEAKNRMLVNEGLKMMRDGFVLTLTGLLMSENI